MSSYPANRASSDYRRAACSAGLPSEQIDVSDVDVSMNGIELQVREFIAFIREGREPNSRVAQVLPCYRTPGELAARVEGA